MFLATTALSEFWDPSQELLLLGQWCLRFDKRGEWKTLKYVLMRSPWEDRARFYGAVRYVDESGERMLKQLAEYLNSVHGVRYSPRYWRILIGPWLLHYLHIVYDRFVHLTDAFDRYPDLQTIVLSPGSFRVPRTTTEFVHLALDDPYNLQIFSQLMSSIGRTAPAREIKESLPDVQGRVGPAGAVRRGVVSVSMQKWMIGMRCALGPLLEKRRHAALCGIHASRAASWLIALRSGLRALPMSSELRAWSLAKEPVFDARRANLAALPSSDEVERVFVQSLPQNFPTFYLEGYENAHTEVLCRSRRVPPVIASATGWYFNETFSYFAAEAAERGSRLVTMQHGGGYGIPRVSAAERHEARLADSFFVWGWAENGVAPYANLPSPRLSSLMSARRKQDDRATEAVLFVSTAYLRYLLRFHSFQVGLEIDEYFRWQLRFLTSVPDRIRRAVLFRPYDIDRAEAPPDAAARCEHLLERFGDLNFDTTKRFYSSLKRSRLVVIDHLGTTLLESLRYGVPTILFWSPQWTDVRAEAEPYFEDLRAVGVLWDSPEAAAAKVADVYHDPRQWWESGPVRDARQRFVDRYALGRHDWAAVWRKTLKAQVAVSRERREPGDLRHAASQRVSGQAAGGPRA